MSDGSLRPMRPIKRTPFVEERLPVLDPEAAHKPGKPAQAAPHRPCAGFGLNTPANEKEFAHGFKKLQKEWAGLKSAALRRQSIEDLANAQLQKGGVPRVGVISKDFATDDGQFDLTSWKLAINSKLLNTGSLSEAQAKKLAGTVYHESRHAEQWYLIAQQKAAELAGGKGQTPEQQARAVGRAMSIPQATAAQAQQHPLDAHDPRGDCAKTLNDSVYGAHADHRKDTLNSGSKTIIDLEHAQAHFDSVNGRYEHLRLIPDAGPDAVHKAYTEAVAARSRLMVAAATQQKAAQAYRHLPEEADAWEAEEALGKIY